jgi:hypothetical protein
MGLRIGITRWGGSITFLRSDLFQSNTNNTDFKFIKAICTLGITVSMLTKPSKSIQDLMIQRENHIEWEPWMSNLLDDWSHCKVPDMSKYNVLLIQQGSENLRITGMGYVSTQLYVYRLLRDFRGAVFYLGYDAYIPFWPVTETRLNRDQQYYSCNTYELFEGKNWNILCPGNRVDLYKTLYDSWGVSKFLNFKHFKRDTHDLMYQTLYEVSDDIKFGSYTRDTMAFIGKDRNGGSRYQFFMECVRNDDRILLDLYGSWDKADFGDQANKTIFNRGRVSRGISNVIKTYNDHICSPLIANSRYVEANQLTARVFEVISAKILPLIEESWANKFMEYLPLEAVKLLVFNTKTLGSKFVQVKNNPEWAIEMSKYVFSEFYNSFFKYNPFREVFDLLVNTNVYSNVNGHDVVMDILKIQRDKALKSNYTRTRNNADNVYNDSINYYCNPLETPSISIKEIYGFKDSDLSEEILMNYFKR